MHGAPAVSYPAGRSSLAGAWMLATWLAAAGGIALWAIQARTTPLGVAGACATLVAAGAIALRAWLRSHRGVLAWDGAGWSWAVEGAVQPGTPVVALDAQRLLLLRWQGERRACWLWLERKAQPLRWDDLRRAVYSSRATP